MTHTSTVQTPEPLVSDQGESLAASHSTPLKTIATLTLLFFVLPINLVIVLIAFLWQGFSRLFQVPTRSSSLQSSSSVAKHPKTILLTGGKMTKALQLARSFHAAGHRVILVETEKYGCSGHQFSYAVEQFYPIPSPAQNLDGYLQTLRQIVQQEQVDMFVPVSTPLYDDFNALTQAVLSPYCEVFNIDAETTRMLGNKAEFNAKIQSLGLPVPETILITDLNQILDFDFAQSDRQYILKSIRYDSVRRLQLTKLPLSSRAEMEAYLQQFPISRNYPYIMQEFITGQEYCTHSTVRQGQIQLHCCCPSSAFQVNYEHTDNPEIFAWVKQVVEALHLTGQISFDLMQTADGTVYPIECNPRTHSAITAFHDHPQVADAYLSPEPLPQFLQPLPHSKPTYWIYHEVWRLNEVRSLSRLRQWFQQVRRGKDAIFQLNDPLPFLMVHHWQIPLLLLGNLRKAGAWLRIDFNIGKLVELDGD